jgi:hypothetical protein
MVYSDQLQATHCYEKPGVEGRMAGRQGEEMVRRGMFLACSETKGSHVSSGGRTAPGRHDLKVNFAQRLQDEANLAAMPAGGGVSQSHVTWMFGIKNNQRPTRNAEDALIETNSGRMLRNRATIAATMNSPRKGRVG